MKYIKRELHEQFQLDLDAAGFQKAKRKWDRVAAKYRLHFKKIRRKLPPGMRAFAGTSLHDGIVKKAVQTPRGDVLLEVDAWNNPWGPRKLFHLKWTGVLEVNGLKDLLGQWWLYEEVHLHPAARFEYHVLFDKNDFCISANELKVSSVRSPSSKTKTIRP